MAEENKGAADAPVAQEAGSGVAEGNLTFDQIQGMFAQPAEAGESTEVSTEGEGEAQEQVTDAEPETEEDSIPGDTEGDEPEQTEEPESDDVLSKLSPKAAEKARKRIDKLTARAKSAEEKLEAQTKEIENLRQMVESIKQEKAEPKQDEARELTFADRVNKAETANDLAQLRDIARKTKEWCRENWDEHEVELGDKVISHKELAQMLNEAERVLEDEIPKRQQYIKQREVVAQNALRDFPAWKDKEHPDHKRLLGLWNDPVARDTFHKLPNGAYLVGVMLEGIKAMEARQKGSTDKSEQSEAEAKPTQKKEQKVAPRVPGTDAGVAPSPSSDKTDFEKRFSGSSSLSHEDLVAYFASQERAKANRKG